jgi:hypothetical protein
MSRSLRAERARLQCCRGPSCRLKMSDESPEPSHPLDAGLRAQAAKRRAELGAKEPEMPGPMRAQLQAEISRQVAREDRSGAERPGFLAWLFQWQRALATVGITLLLISFYAWNDGWFARRSATLNKQAAQNTLPAAPANSAAESPTDALATRADKPVEAFDEKEQAKPAPAAPSPSEEIAAGKLEQAPKIAQPAAPSVAAAPSVSAPPASEVRSEAFATKSAEEGLRQNFVNAPAQLAERARRSAAKETKDERAAPLQNEFEFRQKGNRVEIVDADGSVYAGEIESNLKKDKGLAGRERDRATASAPAGETKVPTDKTKNDALAAQFNFRASGMNNTLRQKVTIEGVYQGPAGADLQNAPGAAATGGATAQDALKAGRPQSQRQVQSRARVVGRAQVNGRNVEVDAEATK